MEAVVYVAQEPTAKMVNGVPVPKDLSSAQRYGKIQSILGPYEGASNAPEPSYQKMWKALQEFDPEKDFLCMAGGDYLSLGLALLALRNRNFSSVKVLRWQRERDLGDRMPGGFYIPVTVPLR